MHHFLENIRHEIQDTKSLEKALSLTEIYGGILWNADMGIYDAYDLEVGLVEAFSISDFNGNTDCSKKDCIHVISEPYLIGGHTRLMENLAKMHPESVDLLITRKSKDDAVNRVASYFANVHLLSSFEREGKVKEIVSVITQYSRVVLHIHPDDILTVVACGIAKKICPVTIYFVNHADHVFTFAASVADYYFEISLYGKNLDLRKRIKGQKTFLGIPISAPTDTNTVNFKEVEKPLRFFSAASAAKFKPIKGFEIMSSIDAILAKFEGSTFCVLGVNPYTNYWWWRLKIKYRNRLFLRPHLPYEQFKLQLNDAHFYMDSHPVPGGTAFAEQLLQGRRCIGLTSPIQGYSPADKLKSPNLDDLIRTIESWQYDEAIVKSVMQVHGLKSVQARYLDCLYQGLVSRNLIEESVYWSGDINFFREEGKIRSPIPEALFISLWRLNRTLSIKLFFACSVTQKCRAILKIAILQTRLMMASTKKHF